MRIAIISESVKDALRLRHLFSPLSSRYCFIQSENAMQKSSAGTYISIILSFNIKVFFSRDWWYFQDYLNTFFAASYPELTLINTQGEHNVFDKIGKICLFGRAKMFMDGQSPRVVEMYEGK